MVAELADLQDPSPELLDVVDQINTHALMFGNTNGSRRRKALAGSLRPRVIVSTLNAALRSIGLTLEPEYDTPRQRKQGTPVRYRLR